MIAYERSLRLFAAPFIFIYGFVKPWQFAGAFANTTAPTNELEGMSLMWAFFGYSTFVPVFIGVFECLGAILLIFDRTKILGALLLLPVLVNIVLFDLAYEVSTFPTVNGIIYLTIIFVVLLNERSRLLQAVVVLQVSKSVAPTSGPPLAVANANSDTAGTLPTSRNFSLARVFAMVGMLALNWILFLLVHDVAGRLLNWLRVG